MRKKIIFLEREKYNFNSMLKLKSVSIFITIFSQKIISGRLLLANIGEKKNNFFRKRKIDLSMMK